MAAPPPDAGDLTAGDLTGAAARFRADLAACGVGDDRLLVAVSGGGDSVALLLLAHAVLGDRCVAATVDHGLRAAAAGEAAWVAGLCAARGIGHATLAGALPARAGRTANLPARARALRYRLLEEEAVRVGARWIATAHHADDQLETLVMRLGRGAGLGGLAGIRARRGRIVRPLLGWRRAGLAALVAAAGLVPVDDPSNRDDRHARARVRKGLATVDWLDAAAAARSAAALAAAEEALGWAADRLAARCCTFAEGEARLAAAAIPAELHRRLVLACLRHVDPAAAAPDGPALARFCARLGEGRAAMLGEVLATPGDAGDDGVPWHFRRAPPRRSSRAPVVPLPLTPTGLS